MSELKKYCQYCSNFRNNRCQLYLFEVGSISDCFDIFVDDECFDGIDFDDIEDQIQNNIVVKDPDDFYCKYYY